MTEAILSPTNDAAFKRMFGTEHNKDILMHFLNSMLRLEGPRAIVEANLDIDTPSYRQAGIFNILCVTEDGQSFFVEMLVSNTGNAVKRAQYYGMLGYANQKTSGGFYSQLKPLVFLEILNFVAFPKQENYRSVHRILDEETKRQSLNDLSYVFIELPKFSKDRPEDLVTNEDKWCYFFSHSSNYQAMRPVLEAGDPEMRKAYDELMAYRWTEQELWRYEAVQKAIMDMRSAVMTAKEEGQKEGLRRAGEIKRQEGIEIGVEKGATEKS